MDLVQELKIKNILDPKVYLIFHLKQNLLGEKVLYLVGFKVTLLL